MPARSYFSAKFFSRIVSTFPAIILTPWLWCPIIISFVVSSAIQKTKKLLDVYLFVHAQSVSVTVI